MRVLSGIQSSGLVHLGRYLGAIKEHVKLQDEGNECLYFIADLHSLTSITDPETRKKYINNVVLAYLAFGLNPDKSIFFLQSSIPEVTEFTWHLMCLAPMGLLERCHSYKDKTSRGLPTNTGLFTYPVLMASDILIYDANIVPVGKDQKQHVEVTRDIAIKFNMTYGDTLVVPEPRINDDVAVIPGIDGQKMSSSYGNTIDLFLPEKKLRKQIMKIVTDSTPVEEKKDPDKCNLFTLYSLIADDNQIEEMRKKYLAGGLAYGHAKQEFFELLMDQIKPVREKFFELEKNPEYVSEVLQKGAEKAREIASKTMGKVRKASGLDLLDKA